VWADDTKSFFSRSEFGLLPEPGDAAHRRNQFVNKLQPLRPEFPVQQCHAGQVLGRPTKGSHETKFPRITADFEDDRNCGSSCLCCDSTWRCYRGKDGDTTLNKVGCHRWQPVIMIFRPAILKRQVAALRISQLPQALVECFHSSGIGLRRSAIEDANYGERRPLLRPHG